MLFSAKTTLTIIRNNFLFILILISLFGCADVSKKSAQNEKQANTTTTEISKDEAVEIAKRYVSFDSDVEIYDAIIHDRKTYWGIEFVFEEEYKHLTGGGAVVEIDKKSGKILREYFAR